MTLGFRTAFPDNYLRPLARAKTAELAEAKLEEVCAAIRRRLGPLVYAEGEETMPAVVGRLLREQGKTLALAESCTGGLLAEQISEVPGASAYFKGGVVAYANAAKTALLGVLRGAARAPRCGVGGGGARDGGGGQGALRRGPRGRHHRHLGPGRRHAGEAGRPGVRGVGAGRGNPCRPASCSRSIARAIAS